MSFSEIFFWTGSFEVSNGNFDQFFFQIWVTSCRKNLSHSLSFLKIKISKSCDVRDSFMKNFIEIFIKVLNANKMIQ